MCKAVNLQVSPSNPSLTEQLGGESQMNFLLMNFCQNIQEDTDLSMLFKQMDLDRLSDIMESLLKAGFESNILDEHARNSIVMKHYALFELGINTRHFKKVKVHFESALRDCWVEEELLQECTQRFGALQSIFEEEGAELRRTAKVQEDLSKRILAATTA
mmetsp:Transcript_28075/g.68366  ORF Transcript_28075/g.68366 Transcript_28075/m.68366 type:complete len:160 (+) Transcript_28075:57-536(+)